MKRRNLKRRFGLTSIGRDFDYQIGQDCTFGAGCRLGGPAYVHSSTIGRMTYIEIGCRISESDIGSFCSIAPYTIIGLAEHPAHFVSTHPIFYRHLPVCGYDLVPRDVHTEMTRTSIGNDVWIGVGACIKSGVTIGDGAIIGAGSVVTKDVEPYAIYAGVPARRLRYRFDPETIERLMALRWWDRDMDWLRRNAHAFRDPQNMALTSAGPS